MIKIIISALNEAQNLAKLLKNINCEMQNFSRNYEIILCLDGSDDESQNIISEIPFTRILPIKKQFGLGLAYKRLFLEIIEKSAPDDIIISLDGDNTHNPAQLKDIIENFELKKLDLLVASRFCQNSKMSGFPLYRQIISKITSIILQNIFAVKKITQQNLKDYSSGYRAYSAKALKDLHKILGDNFILEKDFIYTCEILINLAKNHARIDEFPLNYEYDKKIGVSKLRILRNAKGLILLILRLSKPTKNQENNFKS